MRLASISYLLLVVIQTNSFIFSLIQFQILHLVTKHNSYCIIKLFFILLIYNWLFTELTKITNHIYACTVHNANRGHILEVKPLTIIINPLTCVQCTYLHIACFKNQNKYIFRPILQHAIDLYQKKKMGKIGS